MPLAGMLAEIAPDYRAARRRDRRVRCRGPAGSRGPRRRGARPGRGRRPPGRTRGGTDSGQNGHRSAWSCVGEFYNEERPINAAERAPGRSVSGGRRTCDHLTGGGPLSQAAGRPPQALLPRRGLISAPLCLPSAVIVRARDALAHRNARKPAGTRHRPQRAATENSCLGLPLTWDKVFDQEAPYHLVQLLRDAARGWRRRGAGGVWDAQPAAGRLHPRLLGTRLHPEFGPVAARRIKAMSRPPAVAGLIFRAARLRIVHGVGDR
jgi:hypothetical protein